jgi:repressor LexA
MRTKYEQLTKKQGLIWRLILKFLDENGRFPTVRELCALSGRSSPATIQSYLHALESKGVLQRRNGSWTALRTSDAIPLVGVVPAGAGREVFYPLEEEIELPPWFRNEQEDLVALHVTGDSMIDAYIQDGDLVVIRKGPVAEAEQMVVARLEDAEITLKRLRREGNRFILVPENPSYQPIRSSFTVLGVVVGILRKYR